MNDCAASMNGQVSWVYTHDLEATSVFYRDILGLVCERDQGRARLFRSAPNAWIGVCEAFDDRVVESRGSMISIVTAEVDRWYSRLLARGLDIDPPQRLETFGVYSLLVRDPDGYAIEFQQFER